MQVSKADAVVHAVVHGHDVELNVGVGGGVRAERRVDEADGGDAGVGEGAAAGAEEEVEQVERVEVEEGGGGEALPVVGERYGSHDVILQILPDATELINHADAVLFQLLLRTDAGEHEELG